MPVRLEPAAPRSRVKHSTTELPQEESEEMLFKTFLKTFLQVLWPFCSAVLNHLCYFSRGLYGEHSCEIIFNLVQSFRMRCFKKRLLMLDEDQSQ